VRTPSSRTGCRSGWRTAHGSGRLASPIRAALVAPTYWRCCGQKADSIAQTGPHGLAGWHRRWTIIRWLVGAAGDADRPVGGRGGGAVAAQAEGSATDLSSWQSCNKAVAVPKLNIMVLTRLSVVST